jgi:hypothetical protein
MKMTSRNDYSIWLLELDAAHRIKHLLEMAKNCEISRRGRRAALEEARELNMTYFGENRWDSCGSQGNVEDLVNKTTDSDNSSVSSVSAVSSEPEYQKELLGERFHLDTPSGWHDYLCFLRERKEEKGMRLKLQKREAKRASIAIERRRRDQEERRWADEQRHQARQLESRILDDALRNPILPENLCTLFGKLGFSWNPETSCWEHNDLKRYQLFIGDTSPNEAKIVAEIGPIAWSYILKKYFGSARDEIFLFLDQKSAEESSSIFTRSLFDSDADDEGDD